MADVEVNVEYEVEWTGGAARDMDNAAVGLGPARTQ